MIMKKNSYLEKIRNHSVVEINKSLNEERSKLNSLRFDLFAGKVKMSALLNLHVKILPVF